MQDESSLRDAFASVPDVVKNHLRYGTFYLPAMGLHYVSIPKAACTAMKWWIAGLMGLGRDVTSRPTSAEVTEDLLIHDALPAACPAIRPSDDSALIAAMSDPNAFRFAIVRNPYTRAFSSWMSKVVAREVPQLHAYPDFLAKEYCSTYDAGSIGRAFEEFLHRVLVGEYNTQDWKNPHWAPQYLLLAPEVFSYQRIYQVEHLHLATKELGERLANHGVTTPPVGRYNETLIPYAAAYLTPNSVRYIQTLYAQDFAEYGYAPDHVPEGRPLPDVALEAIGSLLPHIRTRNQRIWDLYSEYSKAKNSTQSARNP